MISLATVQGRRVNRPAQQEIVQALRSLTIIVVRLPNNRLFYRNALL